MDKLKVSDLENALRERHGWTAGFPPDTVGLGFRCPVMGWSWAVVLAQWALEDLLDSRTCSTRA